MIKLTERYIKELIVRALEEDIGSGDITTSAIASEERVLTAELIFKSDWGVLCGRAFFERAFLSLDSGAEFEWNFADGNEMRGGCVVSKVRARGGALLSAERCALNFISHLSGITTNTRIYVDKAKGRVEVLDTRKTTPLLRLAEKFAVGIGGGTNHRYGLYDGILIKDNHIRIAGGISEAIKRVKNYAHPFLKIEVEVSDLGGVKRALNSGADVIMLDNMGEGDIKKAVEVIGERAGIEISGGVTLENIGRFSELGADYISIGALTHHAVWLDFSLEVMTDDK